MSEPPSAIPPITVQAAPEHTGQRLDKFLSERIGTISRSRVKGLIQEGFLRRDGVITTDPSELIKAAATYTLSQPAAAPATPIGEAISFPILYEDKYLLVLDKPAGLVVHPAPGNPTAHW